MTPANFLSQLIIFIVTLLFLPKCAECSKKKSSAVAAQPRVTQDVPRPVENEQVTEELLKRVTGGDAVFSEGKSVGLLDYHRCIHHMTRTIDPIHRVFHNYGRVDPNDGVSSDGFSSPGGNSSDYVTALPEWCRFKWVPRHRLFAGIDSIVFLGDSVLLRAFHDIFVVPSEVYFQKIVTIDDTLNGTVELRSGKKLKIYFFRNLFAATLPHTLSTVLDPKKGFVSSRSLVVMTMGIHDARWLVFRQPPPNYRKGQIGSWSYAKRYWNKNAAVALDVLNHYFHSLANSSDLSVDFPAPFFVFRDPVPPSCDHPKYANRQKVTRCPDLLSPIVLPWYRDTISAVGALRMGVPMISMDGVMPPCGLIDAGHLYRWCKEAELQMIVQAFRLGRRLGVRQGTHAIVPDAPGSAIYYFLNASWIANVNDMLLTPFAVDNLPMLSYIPHRHFSLKGPYFRVRFDGHSPPMPQWLPSARRHSANAHVEVGPMLVIPSQGVGPLGEFVRRITVRDDNEVAAHLYYHSVRLGIYMHMSLVNTSREDDVNRSAMRAHDESPLEPWSKGCYMSQPSLGRWGVFYGRNITSIAAESDEYSPPTAVTSISSNVTQNLSQPESAPLCFCDEELVARVRRMVNFGYHEDSQNSPSLPQAALNEEIAIDVRIEISNVTVLHRQQSALGEYPFLLYGVVSCFLILLWRLNASKGRQK